MFNQLKSRAQALKTETYAIYLAARDPRTPWYAKSLIFFVVAYALSPIDLIPDFIPVLGYLDDLLIIPAGLALAVRLIPPVVLSQAREQAREQDQAGGAAPSRRAATEGSVEAASKGLNRGVAAAGAVLIISIWIILLIWMVKFILAFRH